MLPCVTAPKYTWWNHIFSLKCILLRVKLMSRMHSFCFWAAWSHRWPKWGCRHCLMKCWVGLRQPLSCAALHRDISVCISATSIFQLPQEQRHLLIYRRSAAGSFSFRTCCSYSVKICCGEELEDPRTILLFRVSVLESYRREGEIAKWCSTIYKQNESGTGHLMQYWHYLNHYLQYLNQVLVLWGLCCCVMKYDQTTWAVLWSCKKKTILACSKRRKQQLDTD